MSLSADDAARLAALKSAYDKLISGSAVASVSSGGRRVEYSKGDIATVKAEIEALEAKCSSGRRQRGAVRFRIS